MLGSPHVRAAPPDTEQSRAGYGFGASLNSPFGIKRLPFFCVGYRWTYASSQADATVSVRHEQTQPFIRLRETKFCKQFGSIAKCFLIVGRSFYPRRQIAKDSKHHCEGNNCLKEIVSNTRLDLQTGSH